MGEKVVCEICGGNFKDINGLEQHKAAKHQFKDNVKVKNKIMGKIIFFIISVIVISGIVLLIASVIKGINYCKTAPAEEINIGEHNNENLKLHIHSDLKIVIDGENQIIPSNIGIGPGIMRPLHTHEVSGEIHMEGPCERDFSLRDFFKIWEKEFNSNCIFDNCNGEIKMTVNGILNKEFENYVIKDEDEIVIQYKSNK